MGNFEDKDRDNKSNKPMGGQQGEQGNKPGSQNEPGRESNPREGQGSGSQRPGSTSPGGSRPKSENDEESA